MFDEPRLTSEPEDRDLPSEKAFYDAVATMLARLPSSKSRAKAQIPPLNSRVRRAVECAHEWLLDVVRSTAVRSEWVRAQCRVTADGIDLPSWLNRVGPGCELPPCVGEAHITAGRLQYGPCFGNAPMEPAVTVLIGQAPTITFVVAQPSDMRALAQMIEDNQAFFERFEATIPLTATSDLGLPDAAPEPKSASRYVAAFVKHVVKRAKDDVCLESLSLEIPIQSPALSPTRAVSVALAFLESHAHARKGWTNLDPLREIMTAVFVARESRRPTARTE